MGENSIHYSFASLGAAGATPAEARRGSLEAIKRDVAAIGASLRSLQAEPRSSPEVVNYFITEGAEPQLFERQLLEEELESLRKADGHPQTLSAEPRTPEV